MFKRSLLAALLLLAVLVPLASGRAEAAFQDQLKKLAGEAIANIPLEAADLITAAGLRVEPLRNLVKLDLKITPISLKKTAGKIELLSLTKIRALASFEFLGHYNLFANERSIRENDVRMIGEGAINISFKGLRLKIVDIPSLVLKLAGREGVCPDISPIQRNPASVSRGGTYDVAADIASRSSGHLAYFLFANNKAAVSSDPTLRTILATKNVNYRTPIAVQREAAPDDYFGNVMAIELISKTNNPLDFGSYDVLFSTGITMITVK